MLNHIRKTYHRNILEEFLKKEASLIEGSVLDVGSQKRKYDHLFSGKVFACDINADEKLNIEKQNVVSLSYQDNAFDNVICLEVLEYLEVYDFKKALSELKRVAKKSCLITIPFYYKDHKDNFRVTFSYLEKILNDMNVSYEIKKIGNRFTSSYDATRYSFLERRIVFPVLLFKFVMIKLFSLHKIEDDFYSGLFIKVL